MLVKFIKHAFAVWALSRTSRPLGSLQRFSYSRPGFNGVASRRMEREREMEEEGKALRQGKRMKEREGKPLPRNKFLATALHTSRVYDTLR